MKIRLTKLKESDNPLHPNNIEPGYVKEGEFHNEPTVGEPFWVGNWWRTSIVKEVLDANTFRTCNSIYRFEIIE